MKAECSSIVNKALFNQYNSKINQYAETLSGCRKTIRKYEENLHLTKAKNSLMINIKPNERGSLIANEELAYSGSQKLEEAKRVLSGTEDVGRKIMGDMDMQSDQMKGVNAKIGGMNNQLDGSNDVLRQMEGRYTQNKKLFIILGVTLVGILIIIITIKLLF